MTQRKWALYPPAVRVVSLVLGDVDRKLVGLERWRRTGQPPLDQRQEVVDQTGGYEQCTGEVERR